MIKGRADISGSALACIIQVFLSVSTKIEFTPVSLQVSVFQAFLKIYL